MTEFLNTSDIYVCGVERASKLLMSTSTAGEVDACISIADPYGGKRPPKTGFFRVLHRLVLTFDDVTHDGDNVLAPTRADVELIIDFARRTRVRPNKRMLIHCHAGISRSTATALIVLAERLGPGKEAEAIEAMRRGTETDEPFPNERLVALADEALARGGALLAAAKAMWTVTDAGVWIPRGS